MNTLLICLIVCSVYSFVVYRLMSSRINKKIDNKEFLKSVKEEINSLITQINETSDRNVMLVENRLERLNSALTEADRKLSSLKMASTMPINKNIIQTPAVQVPIIEEKIIEEEEIEIPKIIIDDNPTLTRRERILLLHQQGISSSIIASQTKATIGEVELIISLSRG